jgi:hypothetical protein
MSSGLVPAPPLEGGDGPRDGAPGPARPRIQRNDTGRKPWSLPIMMSIMVNGVIAQRVRPARGQWIIRWRDS